MKALVVTQAFGDFARGDQITDAAMVKAISASANAPHVVRVELPETKAPAPPKAAEASAAEV